VYHEPPVTHSTLPNPRLDTSWDSRKPWVGSNVPQLCVHMRGGVLIVRRRLSSTAFGGVYPDSVVGVGTASSAGLRSCQPRTCAAGDDISGFQLGPVNGRTHTDSEAPTIKAPYNPTMIPLCGLVRLRVWGVVRVNFLSIETR